MAKIKKGNTSKRVMLKDITLGANNKVAGFVESIRNKKAMCFIVLRDVSGKLQITIEKSKHPSWDSMLASITTDTVIEAVGPIVKSEYVKLNGMEINPSIINS